MLFPSQIQDDQNLTHQLPIPSQLPRQPEKFQSFLPFTRCRPTFGAFCNLGASRTQVTGQSLAAARYQSARCKPFVAPAATAEPNHLIPRIR
jgi:hypothetical protein